MDSKGVDKNCNRRGWSNRDKRPAEQVRIMLTEEQLKGFFKRYDTDGDGRLSNQELKDAFQSLGSRWPGWRAWRALHHADSNGDRFISEDEFQGLVNYMLKHGYAKKD